MAEPDIQNHLASQWLFDLTLEIDRPNTFSTGKMTSGTRLVVPISSGSFKGPGSDNKGLQGKVLPGGADWVVVKADGNFTIDVRLSLKTDQDQTIYMNYQGVFQAEPEQLARYHQGEVLPASDCYLRTVVSFETAAPELAELNHAICIGKGRQTQNGVVYQIFKIL